MPVYEYQCKKCGVFEMTQRITDPALKKCPTCRGKVERLVSHSSFILKGSGWYATDYAHKGSSAPAESASSTSSTNGTSSSASSSSTSTTSSTESKPAAEKATASKTAD